MSLNSDGRDGWRPSSAVATAILDHPRVVTTGGASDSERAGPSPLVGAVDDELLVQGTARRRLTNLDMRLREIAEYAGSLVGGGERDREDPDGGQAVDHDVTDPADVEIWRIRGPEPNSIQVAMELRNLVGEREFVTAFVTDSGETIEVPAVSPNHICVVSPKNSWCPAGAPHSTPLPPVQTLQNFLERQEPGLKRAHVIVFDTGYIHTDPPHVRLDERVKSVAGEWYDTHAVPPRWRRNPPDELDANGDGRLDGVAGHGTFVAGLVAHVCRQVELTVVGQRHEVVSIGNLADPAVQAMLFTTEFSLAHSVLQHCDADVLQCGFAFPTLSDYPSIPFAPLMAFLTSPAAPRPGVAVVAPAGNESSADAYWPAAHPDVVGIAAANTMSNDRALFSNWGDWASGCTRGEYVLSTYIHWFGPVQGEPLTDLEHFTGWARWDGTSFAAPQVAGRIAAAWLDRESVSPGITPRQVWAELSTAAVAAGDVIVDDVLNPAGVALPLIPAH